MKYKERDYSSPENIVVMNIMGSNKAIDNMRKVIEQDLYDFGNFLNDETKLLLSEFLELSKSTINSNSKPL